MPCISAYRRQAHLFQTEMHSNPLATRPSEAETESAIRAAVTNGATRYIHGCEMRIEDFVRRNYSFRGALRIHSHAVGWDVIRVPINIAWSVVNLLFAAVGLIASLLRLRRVRNWIGRIPPGLETDMDRQISWLVVTELLQLPYEHGGKRSERDSLMEEILKDLSLRQLIDQKLEAFEEPSKKPDFQRNLKAKLSEYGATRTGSSDAASNAALLITSKLAMGQASYGTIGAGGAVSTLVAKSIAVSNFWLGSTVGSYYYAVVPVAVSMRLFIAVTAVIAIVLALVSTFIGLLTDPIQAKLGIHQKRLRKLISAIGDDLHGRGEAKFELREKYVGRIFDVVDVITTLARAL